MTQQIRVACNIALTTKGWTLWEVRDETTVPFLTITYCKRSWSNCLRPASFSLIRTIFQKLDLTLGYISIFKAGLCSRPANFMSKAGVCPCPVFFMSKPGLCPSPVNYVGLDELRWMTKLSVSKARFVQGPCPRTVYPPLGRIFAAENDRLSDKDHVYFSLLNKLNFKNENYIPVWSPPTQFIIAKLVSSLSHGGCIVERSVNWSGWIGDYRVGHYRCISLGCCKLDFNVKLLKHKQRNKQQHEPKYREMELANILNAAAYFFVLLYFFSLLSSLQQPTYHPLFSNTDNALFHFFKSFFLIPIWFLSR